jgi:predicted RNA-binding protein
MKGHAPPKSSFTLAPAEHARVKRLRRLLKARSNAEVIRQSLKLLEESLTREELRRQFVEAAARVKSSTVKEMRELDGVIADGLGDA